MTPVSASTRAERRRLFRRFYRTSTALNRPIPGIGLGPVIARPIIERHHGAIDRADHPGPGATFSIKLPTKSRIGGCLTCRPPRARG